MTWPNPFRRSDATRTAFGYTFQLTEYHLTSDQMESMKMSFDKLGEKAWEKIAKMSPQPRSDFPPHLNEDEAKLAADTERTEEKPPGSKKDPYELLRLNYFNDEALGQLWTEVNTVPSWVCWDQIARGQDCFYRYGGPILNGLAFQSLLGGMVKPSGPVT